MLSALLSRAEERVLFTERCSSKYNDIKNTFQILCFSFNDQSNKPIWLINYLINYQAVKTLLLSPNRTQTLDFFSGYSERFHL